jgi:hypothetical protein
MGVVTTVPVYLNRRGHEGQSQADAKRIPTE